MILEPGGIEMWRQVLCGAVVRKMNRGNNIVCLWADR